MRDGVKMQGQSNKTIPENKVPFLKFEGALHCTKRLE